MRASPFAARRVFRRAPALTEMVVVGACAARAVALGADSEMPERSSPGRSPLARATRWITASDWTSWRTIAGVEFTLGSGPPPMASG
jgi:hypothetical protein